MVKGEIALKNNHYYYYNIFSESRLLTHYIDDVRKFPPYYPSKSRLVVSGITLRPADRLNHVGAIITAPKSA